MRDGDTEPVNSTIELRRLAEMVLEMPERTSLDAVAVLKELTYSAVRSVPGAQHAGITVTDRHHHIETHGATGQYPALLDDIQRRHGEGPCVSAAWQHHTMRIDDLATDQRWPRYREEALRRTPVRSVLSFDIFNDRQMAGALNFYAERAYAFGDESLEVGLAFATHAALAWNISRRDDQFRSALASRDIIGQAKGMLMERFGTDAVAAFDLLKRLSQETNTPVVEIAHRVVNAARPPRHPPAT